MGGIFLRARGPEPLKRWSGDHLGVETFARIHDPEDNLIELWEPAAS